jgi:hypothetical protein
MQMKMTEYHVGQSVKVLKRTDTLDKPWTEGTIIGVYNGAVAPGYQVVMHGAATVPLHPGVGTRTRFTQNRRQGLHAAVTFFTTRRAIVGSHVLGMGQ